MIESSIVIPMMIVILSLTILNNLDRIFRK